MARRSHPLDDLLQIAASLPWWLGVLLAALSYFLLHAYAASPIEPTGTISGGNLAEMAFKAFATAGQYILPIIFIAGSLLSLFTRLKQKTLHARATTSEPLAVISQYSWQDFEDLIAEAFHQQGFKVAKTPAGADGGVDLELRDLSGERHLVQCKHWRATKVGVNVVRELFGVMAARGATGGYVVTAGRFTREAEQFAAGRNIELVDGETLQQWLQRVETAKETSAEPGRLPEPGQPAATSKPVAPSVPMESSEPAEPAMPPEPVTEESPRCPKCDGPMVRRMAKKGPTAGTGFWGCSHYPACRGTRSLDDATDTTTAEAPQPVAKPSPSSPALTETDYRNYREPFRPAAIRAVVIAESPPASGLYFYRTDGKPTEPLFKAMMDEFLGRSYLSKDEGLTAFRDAGFLLLDATYTQVNQREDRDDVIRADYGKLKAEFDRIAVPKETPLILVKKNVCEILEPLLVGDGYHVANQGQVIYFPSTGQQGRYRDQVRPILERLGMAPPIVDVIKARTSRR